MVEVPTFGLGSQQFLIGRCRNSAEAIDCSPVEVQFQKASLDAIGSTFQGGGVEFGPLHGNYWCRAGKLLGLGHSARGADGRLRW